MAIVLPGWGAQLGQSLASLGDSISHIIHPNQDLSRAVKQKIALDPKFAADIIDMNYLYPGSLEKVGLKNIQDKLAVYAPRPETVDHKLNAMKDIQLEREKRQQDAHQQDQIIALNTAKLAELKDSQYRDKIPELVTKATTGVPFEKADMEALSGIYGSTKEKEIYENLYKAAQSKIDNERADKRLQQQYEAMQKQEERGNARLDKQEDMRYLSAAIDAHKQSNVGSPQSWKLYLKDPAAQLRASALFEHPKTALTPDAKELLAIEKFTRENEQANKYMKARKFGEDALTAYASVKKAETDSERANALNQLNQNLLARSQITGEREIQAYWDTEWINEVKFRDNNGNEIKPEDVEANIRTNPRFTLKQGEELDPKDPATANILNQALLAYTAATDKDEFFRINEAAGPKGKAIAAFIRQQIAKNKPIITPTKEELPVGVKPDSTKPSPTGEIKPIEQQRKPIPVDDSEPMLFKGGPSSSVPVGGPVRIDTVTVNHSPNVPADTGSVPTVVVKQAPPPTNPATFNPKEQQELVTKFGISDTSRVKVSQTGYKIYDTGRVWKDGKTSTHNVNAPSGRKDNETWEQYEDRVLATPVTHYVKALTFKTDLSLLDNDVQSSAKDLLSEARKAGVNIVVHETYRPQERQELLFKLGRSLPGHIVTWTLTSNHLSRRAIDFRSKSVGKENIKRDYVWLQEHAPELGFLVMGMSDAGHVFLPKNTTLTKR